MQHYQRIRDLREDCDLTQDTLCQKLYMNKSTYTYYEQGKHSVPLDFAVTLADFYHVSLDYLAGRTNIKETLVNNKNRKLTALSPEEVKLIGQFRTLNKRNQNRLEDFIEILEETQKK